MILPLSPNVSREAYVPLAVFLLWMIGNIVITELVSPTAPSDSIVLRLYLAVFGYKRWLITWPIMGLAIWAIDTLFRRLLVRMRGTKQ
jgi:hypothetical protein